jgi:tRNA (cmo5U34)-methyltransferase
MRKSSVDQIRRRFDQDVERFSSLDVGQTTIVDAAMLLDLVASAAAATNPDATHALDIGCGAGNYALKLLEHIPSCNVTLVDLSLPMLERAAQRIKGVTSGTITTTQADIRDLRLNSGCFDIIIAAAVFHHLRTDAEWEHGFAKCYAALKPGGSLWIADLIEHATPQVNAIIWQRYGAYLANVKDEAYRDHVFAYIEQEDTPRSLIFQIDLLRHVGFGSVEILHKNACFAAFGAIKQAASGGQRDDDN